jgi:hypothetical protein
MNYGNQVKENNKDRFDERLALIKERALDVKRPGELSSYDGYH